MEQKTAKRRGGRPSRAEAGLIEHKILDAAAALFFDQGYGAVSIEYIAKRAAISKRTFYARYENKAALFRAVVQRVLLRLRPADRAVDHLFTGGTVADILHRLAPIILHAALMPDSIALQRLMLAEATRFPELAAIMQQEGARQEAVTRISLLLRQAEPELTERDAAFAAEQFLFLLTAGPQRAALGIGSVLTEGERADWARRSVSLFLHGFAGSRIKLYSPPT